MDSDIQQLLDEHPLLSEYIKSVKRETYEKAIHACEESICACGCRTAIRHLIRDL